MNSYTAHALVISAIREKQVPRSGNSREISKDHNWWDDRSRIRSEIPLTDFLYSKECKNYCEDPFNEINEQKFIQALKVPCVMLDKSDNWMPGDSIKIKSPFFISWESMVIDPGLGKYQRATTEMVNKWCMLSIFIQVLMAHKMNQSLVVIYRDTNLHRTILYVMIHHVHNHGNNNLPVHSCMSKVYKFPSKPACLASGECQIIPASLYFAKIVNTVLTKTHHDNISGVKPQVQLQQQRKSLTKAVNDISELLYTMNNRARHPVIDKMIDALGKHFTFWKIFSHLMHILELINTLFLPDLLHFAEKIQYAKSANNSVKLGPEDIKFIQQDTGTFF